MPHPSREMVLVASAARTSSSTSSDITLPEQYTAADVYVNVTNVGSSTTHTLNVYIQKAITFPASTDIQQGVPTGTVTYDDYISFTQLSATGTRVVNVVGGGNVDHAITDGTLTAGTVRNGPIGRKWRVKWVIGGTTPSFTFSVVAQFIP